MQHQGQLSVPKLKAEGTPAKEQIVLGWLLNIQLLLIILPFNKLYEAWSLDRKVILSAK
jgi:hypothetical protein